MARNITRGELRTRLEQLTDTENDAHLSTTEKNEILNSAMAETWDQVCNNGLGSQYVTSNTFTTTAGQSAYALGTVAGSNFYRIHQLYVVENTDQLRALRRVQPSEIQSFKPPQTSGTTLKIYYLPICPELGSGDDASNFDGINGWEEHTLMTAAIAVKLKKDENYNQFRSRKLELEQRMKSLGNVDFGEPPRVSRKRLRHTDPWMSYNNNVNAYVVRGGNLELFYLYGYQP